MALFRTVGLYVNRGTQPKGPVAERPTAQHATVAGARPSLITSTLRKLVKQGHFTPEEGQDALQDLLALGVQLVSPTTDLIMRAYSWAERLDQTVAYDAAYLALAEQEGVELWTGDGRLTNSARSHGVTWIHHLED